MHIRLPYARSRSSRLGRAHLVRLALVAAALLSGSLQIGCRAEQPWPLWEAYSRHMIAGDGRVVDHIGGDRTTSEGQAYAMFFALVRNDRPTFDKLLSWTEANLAGGDLTLRLPAWSWGKNPDGSWKIIDSNPASDADLWIAYDLLEAGRLWREPRYERLGSLLATRIAQQEVATIPEVGTTLIPGAQGFHPNPSVWILNPSYLPPPVLARLSAVFPDGPWSAILSSLQPMLAQGSAGHFAMDWIAAGNAITPSISAAQFASGDRSATPVGSYDAIRVYLWLGLSDRETPGLKGFFESTSGMAGYLHNHLTPPLTVSPDGAVTSTDVPVGFSAAVLPYLHALNLRSEEKVQFNRVSALRDPSTGLFGKQAAYYDQNLVLFATGWSEGRFRFDRDGKLVVSWR